MSTERLEIASSPEASAGRRIAIGDIHGCSFALDTLLQEIVVAPDDTIICLGDVIDTGRESKAVIERLIQLDSECQLIGILGNHEEMLLNALDNLQLVDSWLACGGQATVNSYRFCGNLQDIDSAHIDFLRTFQDYYETDSHILVHANYQADLPMDQQPAHAMRWSLLDEPYPQRHLSEKTVIVGHTEQRGGEILDLEHVVCLDTYCHFSGWLTAMDLDTEDIWQTSRWGTIREPDDQVESLQSISTWLRPSSDAEQV